ncbi:MAG TPA: agmatinase [Candidatus Nanoarchaeia archaeon]|nr:agmatinase [Candidatus Nanoarchaeia archaeon]
MDNPDFLSSEDDTGMSYEQKKVVVLPVPYEGTVSYGKGTSEGPRAILIASSQLEAYDDELDCEPYKAGIWTEKEVPIEESAEKMVKSVYKAATPHITAGKFLLTLGGEHSIPSGIVRAYKEKYSDLSVLHLDAHGDMRDEYDDTKYSHAAVMRRIREFCPAVQVGIRSVSKEEMVEIREKKIEKTFFWARDIVGKEDWFDAAINQLGKNVYITLDIDVFDPSIVPSTGTPEPGGLQWWQVLHFLRGVFEKRNVVGADIVELSPVPGLHASDFLAAKLAYKMIGYKFRGR